MHPDTHADVRHEKSDVSTRGLVLFGVWFVVVLALIHSVLFGYFLGLERKQEAAQPVVPPVARERAKFPAGITSIPGPRLQVEELKDMQALRERENQLLDEYAWVDRGKGTVRLPIDQTLRMLADPKTAAARGLTVRVPEEAKR